ncbi:MAG: ATP-binding cassette domain-containing protein [Kofleriaceae bacterium]|nr:ATP-binding cassette domain-containing protein [Kofleriaceae bacterium]
MAEPLIDVTLDKAYPGCEVLRGATLSIAPGTVHALVGENGAGKSTLVKIIAGVLRGDRGALAVDGRARDVASWNRAAARAAGIGIVQQHGAFAGTLSVVENAVLGVEPRRGPLLDLDATARGLAALGEKIGLPIDPWAPAESLSLGAAQRAEIVAALYHGAKLLVLDEPTAVLAPVEVEGLLATLRELAKSGTTIVIVTHKLDEVRAVADDVTVLRAGRTVATFHGPDLDAKAIARAMVGAELPAPQPVAEPSAAAPAALVVERLTVGDALRDISLAVRAGELVGVAGVDGNGQRELALAIAGLVSYRGYVRVGARDMTHATAAQRLAAGLAHIPEDRQHGGLVLDATISENVVLGRRDVTGSFVIDLGKVSALVEAQIAALDIRPPLGTRIARSLSGGNQQKVVIARELSRPNLAAVIAAQPTRGVDLGAVARIHDRLRAAASAGAGVLVISADLDELLALCHRIVVLLRGQIVGERSGDELRTADARAALGALMTGAETRVAAGGAA